MPRDPRKRGKEVKTRGISREQVCGATAIDRHGNIIMEMLCTDSHKRYIKFTIDLNLEHKRIKSGRHKQGIYHIQHINALHSNLKRWIRSFNGVSTKWLSNMKGG